MCGLLGCEVIYGTEITASLHFEKECMPRGTTSAYALHWMSLPDPPLVCDLTVTP